MESNQWQEMLQELAGYLPNLLGALLILIGGWIVALILSKLVCAGLHKTRLDDKFGNWVSGGKPGKDIDIEKGIGKGVFWLLMLFVLVAFFQALGLTIVTEPLNGLLTQLTEFAPRILGAGILVLVAWIVATVLRMVVTKVLGMTTLDQKLASEPAEGEQKPRAPLSKTLGDTVYWLIFFLFLPAILGALEMQGLLTPVENMLGKILSYLPNLLGAGVIILVGWFVARIVQRIVSSLLSSVGVDGLAERVGLSKALGKQRLSGMIATIVYVLILIPVIVMALNALEMEAISGPASEMLNQILAILPGLFAAVVVLAISFVVGRLVASLVTNLLTGLGFNLVLQRLGLAKQTATAGKTASEIVGTVVLVAIMLLAATEAFGLLGFESLVALTEELYAFGGRLIVGCVIFGLGLFLANLVHSKLSSGASNNAAFLAVLARVAIIVVVAGMAVQQIGIGAEVTNMVIALLLGAVAVAAAIAFGMGSREHAGKLVGGWLESLRK